MLFIGMPIFLVSPRYLRQTKLNNLRICAVGGVPTISSRIRPNPGKKNPAMSTQGYSNSSDADEENLFRYILSNDASKESL